MVPAVVCDLGEHLVPPFAQGTFRPPLAGGEEAVVDSALESAVHAESDHGLEAGREFVEEVAHGAGVAGGGARDAGVVWGGGREHVCV